MLLSVPASNAHDFLVRLSLPLATHHRYLELASGGFGLSRVHAGIRKYVEEKMSLPKALAWSSSRAL